MPTHANYLSILTTCHVTCDTRPSASLHVPNEAGRSGDEASLRQRWLSVALHLGMEYQYFLCALDSVTRLETTHYTRTADRFVYIKLQLL